MNFIRNIFVIITFVFVTNLLSQPSINYFKKESEIKSSNVSELHTVWEKLQNDIEFNYDGEFFSNAAGGIERKNTYINYFRLIINLSSGQITGWKGARLKAFFLGVDGHDINNYIGTTQGISNIAAPNTLKLYELWVEQNLLNNKLSILFGLFDLNSEFDSRVTSGIFINPSHGIGADFSHTGVDGPSIYPNTSYAFRIKYKPAFPFEVKAAVFNAVPGRFFNKKDGLLCTAEIDYKNFPDENVYNFFNYDLGAWYYTGKFKKLESTCISGPSIYEQGNYGIYFSAEKSLFSIPGNPEEGMGAFIRFGITDNLVDQVSNYFGAGIVYNGLIPGRAKDEIGLALAMVRNNKNYIAKEECKNNFVRKYEQIIELTYLYKLSDYFKLQPDIQYVINPTYCRKNNYALAAGVRFELSF